METATILIIFVSSLLLGVTGYSIYTSIGPNAKILVTGCAAQIDPQKWNVIPEVDFVVGNKEKLDETNIKDDKKFEIVEQLKFKLKPEGYNSILIDGLRLENKDCWGLVRASNTTPSLILRFEANTEQKLMEIQELFQKTLLEISTNLKFLN